MSKNKVNLEKVTYFLITGASKGIGQKMAIECAKNFKPGSLVVLLARTASGLEQTKTQIITGNSHIDVITCSIDLSNPSKEDLDKIIKSSLSNYTVKNFEQAMIIHNVGTIGNVGCKAVDLDEKQEWHDYYSTNVFTVALLNSCFLKAASEIERKVVVNITSKCGLVPFPSFTFYGSGKAAREMYFKVLALEEPEMVVLNYSPGPVETDMTVDVQGRSCSSVVKSYFKGIRDDSTILSTEQTTAKFLEVLQGGKFESGDHVDYYDE